MGDYNKEGSPLQIKSTAFAVRITNMVDYIRANRRKGQAPILNQVLRSGTSIMANVGEAQFAQSPADFINKMHVALKEANETRNWLFLLRNNGTITNNEANSIVGDCSEIIAMLVSSINTSKKNQLLQKQQTSSDKPKVNDDGEIIFELPSYGDK